MSTSQQQLQHDAINQRISQEFKRALPELGMFKQGGSWDMLVE